VALFFSTQRWVASGGGWEAFQDALRRSLPQWYVWAVLSPFVFRADSWAKGDGSSLRRRIFRHIPLALALVSLYVILRQVADVLVRNVAWEWSFSSLIPQYHWNFLIYTVLVGLHITYDLERESRARELRASRLETRLAEARLESLRAQLRPHFLFNTLNAISAFTEKDPKAARRVMAHLGDLLRHSLESADRQEVPLAEELSTVEDYLEIQRARFSGRLNVTLDVPPELRAAHVPSFLLQPLVENAIEHGLVGKSAPGCILVKAERTNGSLRVTVADDGRGLSAPWNENENGKGFGLKSTVERLKALYGDRARVEVRNGVDAGVEVTVTLPWSERE
jgi:two-component system LytT family sensor kinase